MTASGPAPSSPEPDAATAAEVASLAGGVVVRGDPAAPVRGATTDSRAVSPAMLFVALPGAQTDGHRFAADACRRGAGAVLVSRDVPGVPEGAAVIKVANTLAALQRLARRLRDRRPLRVVGITGSVGKTTTKELAAAVAGRAFRTARSPQNWNTEIGIPLVLTNLPCGVEVAIVELAMRGPGQIRELVEICRPDVGVVTNVGESHLDFFENREALARAKGELIEGLDPGATAILNADDPVVLAMGGRASARVVTFGVGRGDVTAGEIRAVRGGGSAFLLRTPDGAAEVSLRLLGSHAVPNALAAAGVGWALGVPTGGIAAGLGSVGPLPMRLAVRRIGGVTLLDDTYNSSPQSVEAALDAMDELPGAPRVAVLGDMRELGARSADAHRSVGELAARRGLDLVIAFGPLARTLADAARAAGGVRVVHAEEPEDVLAVLRAELRAGAVVLVKGSRVMAMERIVDGLGVGAPGGAEAERGLAWA